MNYCPYCGKKLVSVDTCVWKCKHDDMILLFIDIPHKSKATVSIHTATSKIFDGELL